MALSSMESGANEAAMPPDLNAGAETVETRFGPIALDPKQQLTFRGGLPGFPYAERLQLSQIPGIESELLLLHGIEPDEPSFVVMPLPQTAPVIADSDVAAVCRSLDIAAGDLLLLAIVTMTMTTQGVKKFANLRAPLFIDVQNRIGAQMVLTNTSYSLRYELKAMDAAA